MARIYNNILETIGNTPVVKINRLAPPGIDMFVKIESFNPMASVKDRMALNVIEQAERDGVLSPGQTVVEATSGNTGIGLAMVCAAKGYPLVLTMAESFSVERRKILRFMGAKVVLTPAELKGSGMLAKAVELAQAHDWFLVRQFENDANADAHTRTTALEILDVFRDRKLDYFVTGYGTGGTLKGTARVLRKKSPQTKIVVCEPDNSQLLGSGIPQGRCGDGSPSESHPNFRPHLMQGWTPDFIPKLTEDAVKLHLVDEVRPIDGSHALEMTQQLALSEGIFCGTSGGATFSGALKVAEMAPPGSTILCMLPDTGERYLSTPLFQAITEQMTPDEMEISCSTPGYRFDVKAPPTVPGESETDAPSPVSAEAEAFVTEVIGDAEQAVVLFALYRSRSVEPLSDVLVVVGGLVLSAVLLVIAEQIYRNAPADTRSGLKYFCLAVVGMFLYDIAMYAWSFVERSIPPDAWAARGYVNALLVVPLAYSVKRTFRLSLEAVSNRHGNEICVVVFGKPERS